MIFRSASPACLSSEVPVTVIGHVPGSRQSSAQDRRAGYRSSARQGLSTLRRQELFGCGIDPVGDQSLTESRAACRCRARRETRSRNLIRNLLWREAQPLTRVLFNFGFRRPSASPPCRCSLDPQTEAVDHKALSARRRKIDRLCPLRDLAGGLGAGRVEWTAGIRVGASRCATLMSLQGQHRGAPRRIGAERSLNSAPVHIVPAVGVAGRARKAIWEAKC